MSKETACKWHKIITNLSTIRLLELSRPLCYAFKRANNTKYYELHCFTDASLYAYAAVVYLRVYDKKKSNKITTSFVMGKSRLAPIKNQDNLQIPRLELLGAVIGNQLIQYVSNNLSLYSKAYLVDR